MFYLFAVAPTVPYLPSEGKTGVMIRSPYPWVRWCRTGLRGILCPYLVCGSASQPPLWPPNVTVNNSRRSGDHLSPSSWQFLWAAGEFGQRAAEISWLGGVEKWLRWPVESKKCAQFDIACRPCTATHLPIYLPTVATTPNPYHQAGSALVQITGWAAPK